MWPNSKSNNIEKMFDYIFVVICAIAIPFLAEGSKSSSSGSVLPRRQHVFDLSDFGAVGDGFTDNTRVFRNAVYAVSGVADKGGGQLYIPPGRYVTGSFNLTSNMTLYLARDAIIIGTKNQYLWPVIAPLPSYGRGRELPGPRHSSLLFGYKIEDVVITGDNGSIDGQGDNWWNKSSEGLLNYSRGSLIELLWVDHFQISNVTLINSPFWTLHPVYCRHVQVSNLTVISPSWARGTEGVVPDSCDHVSISDSFFSTGGDAISLKSGWDEYGISVGIPATNIQITNVILISKNHSGISIGSEMSGGVENVTVTNSKISNSRVGILLSTAIGRGGFVRGIKFERIAMDNVETGFQFLSDSKEHADRGFDPNAIPTVREIELRNIVGRNVTQAGVFHGFQESPFSNFTVENVTFFLGQKSSGFTCSFVSGVAKNVIPKMCPEIATLNSSLSTTSTVHTELISSF